MSGSTKLEFILYDLLRASCDWLKVCEAERTLQGGDSVVELFLSVQFLLGVRLRDARVVVLPILQSADIMKTSLEASEPVIEDFMA